MKIEHLQHEGNGVISITAIDKCIYYIDGKRAETPFTVYYIDGRRGTETPFTIWNLYPNSCCSQILNNKLEEMIEALIEYRFDCSFLIGKLKKTLYKVRYAKPEQAERERETNTLKTIKSTKDANNREQDFRKDLGILLRKHGARIKSRGGYCGYYGGNCQYKTTITMTPMYDNSSDTLLKFSEFEL